jgi:hypothetical protein
MRGHQAGSGSPVSEVGRDEILGEDGRPKLGRQFG